MKILGIETSCDETAAAVVENGSKILSSVVASQVAIHHLYGGVVPELASRKHIEAIVPVVNQALAEAGMTPKQVEAVAVTQGPGLVGALLVGFCFAKSFAYALNIPWVGIDHLEGHLNSVFLQSPSPEFPFVALLASGGHTSIYRVNSHLETKCLGQTRDDAAGEAFDKVAKMLGLGYPGGRVISQMAEKGDPGRIDFPRPLLSNSAYDFSFSGLKTAVNRYIQAHPDFNDRIADIAAAFQEAVVDVLSCKLLQAARDHDCPRIALVGGVAANQRLRERIGRDAEEAGMALFLPSLDLCGDNAAMIAGMGYHFIISPDHAAGRNAMDVYSRSPLRGQ